ncbi:hypothetical protein D3C80_1420820 [compost metagenome]
MFHFGKLAERNAQDLLRIVFVSAHGKSGNCCGKIQTSFIINGVSFSFLHGIGKRIRIRRTKNQLLVNDSLQRSVPRIFSSSVAINLHLIFCGYVSRRYVCDFGHIQLVFFSSIFFP